MSIVGVDSLLVFHTPGRYWLSLPSVSGHPKLALWVGGKWEWEEEEEESRANDEQKCSCLTSLREFENEQLLITCEINEFELREQEK